MQEQRTGTSHVCSTSDWMLDSPTPGLRSLLIAVVLAAISSAGSAQPTSGGPFTGVGTYYGSGGDGVCKGSGHPGLPQVAMNAAQFEDGETCGACIEVHGTGTGAGENPISTAPFMASVCNVCPECNYGDLDFAESADGRWDIKWHYVPCPSRGSRRLHEEAFAEKPAANPWESVRRHLRAGQS